MDGQANLAMSEPREIAILPDDPLCHAPLLVSGFDNGSTVCYGFRSHLLEIFGPSRNGGLDIPIGMVFGPDGKLHVCSLNGGKVLRFDGSTGAPTGDLVTAGRGGLDAPRGLAFGPDGNLYVAEQYHDSVRRYDGSTVAFLDISVPAGSAGLDRANDVFFGPAWLALGCQPALTAVEPRPPTSTRLCFEVGSQEGSVTLRFVLERAATVDLCLYDLRGRRVARLEEGSCPAGAHELLWRGTDERGSRIARGVYFARLQVADGRGVATLVRKVVLLH